MTQEIPPLTDSELLEAAERFSKDVAVIISNSGLTPNEFFSRLGKKLKKMRLTKEEKEINMLSVDSPT